MGARMKSASIVRRLRYGKPVIVVSGLPRSGTSMAMRMLEAGGVPILTDGVREPDYHNPLGYFEFERVKELDTPSDRAWLRGARGKAVKIVSVLLPSLPQTIDYRVLFMRRNLDEVIESQNKMLADRGEHVGRDESTRLMFARHLETVTAVLSTRRCFRTLYLDYGSVIEQPDAEARRIRDFLGCALDTSRVVHAVDQRLYRNRVGTLVERRKT
jgi:hypothetical protein